MDERNWIGLMALIYTALVGATLTFVLLQPRPLALLLGFGVLVVLGLGRVVDLWRLL